MVIARDDSKAAIRAAAHAEAGERPKPCLPRQPREHASARQGSMIALLEPDLSWGLLAMAGSFQVSMQVTLSIAQCLLSRLRVRPSSMRQHRRRPLQAPEHPDANITLAGSFADRSPSRERSANEAIGWLTAVPSSIIRNAEPDPRVAGSKPQRQAGHAGLTRGLQFRQLSELLPP
jgi:hypothetical protein